MKKNLKKVISAVLALTLALSSFVALNVSAASFADVADTASYSEAVAALKALGAIAGYEDGTFLPDNKITRAEAVTMIVAALNQTEDAKNSGATTQFADVNANAAWAAGYVNVGVAQGFISGMSATEFAPSANVTYAQMLSILTRILGYGEFAATKGGYPNGYLTAASMAGILTGVSAAADTEVTRAQVAQLIWNAVQAPMLDITTFSTSSTGSEMQKMDGKDSRDFKTVLSENFDAYVLNIEVTGTSKGGDIEDAGYINMKLTGSNDWDPDLNSIVKNVSDANQSKLTKAEVAVGDTDAENYPFSSAKVIAEYNDDGDWTLLYFAPTSKVVQKAVDGSLVKEITTEANGDLKLKIKKSKTSSSTTDYKLTADAMLYVNGVEYKAIKGNEADVISLLGDSYGDTVLVEGDKSAVYNKVMIDYYATAKVSQVTAKSDRTKVTLNSLTYNKKLANPRTSFEITADDIADGVKAVSVTKGKNAVELSALAVDDVVAIRWNVKDTFDASKFLDVLATSETVTGKYTSYDEDDDLYTIGDNQYEAVPGVELGLEFASTYTFRLDPLGRLFSSDEEATSKNYAIVERYVPTGASSSSEYDYISVMTLDGQQKTLYIEDDAAGLADVKAKIKDTVKATAKAVAIKDRVISYDVKNSNGRIKSMSFVTDLIDGTAVEAEYNVDANRLGKPLSSNAIVLDATNYKDLQDGAKTTDYKASSLAALNNGTKYNYILVNKSSSTGEYSYVIITGAGSVFNGESNFAVIAADASVDSMATVDDEDVYTAWVMQNGEDTATKLNIATDAKIYFGSSTGVAYNKANCAAYLGQGAVFFYQTDEDGFVDEISVVMKGTAQNSFTSLLKNSTDALANDVKLPASSDSKTIAAADWKVQINDFRGDKEDIQIFVAPVYLAKSNSISFATIKTDESGKKYVDVSDSYSYSLKDTSKVYAYDMSSSADTGRYALSNGSFAGIATSDLNNEKTRAYLADGVEGANNITDTVQMAFVMVVDGVITNALIMSQR